MGMRLRLALEHVKGRHEMRNFWLVLFVLVMMALLLPMFLGPSFAAQRQVRVPLPGRSGLYVWSAETGQFRQIDRVVEGVRQAQNQLYRQVFSLEQRIKALERD